MEENWINSKERFRNLQGQARSQRDEIKTMATELAELKAKMEVGTSSEVSSGSNPVATDLSLRHYFIQATTQAAQAELQQKLTALEIEKASLESRLKEIEASLEARIKEQSAALQTQVRELEQKHLQLEQTAKETETKLEATEKERAVSSLRRLDT